MKEPECTKDKCWYAGLFVVHFPQVIEELDGKYRIRLRPGEIAVRREVLALIAVPVSKYQVGYSIAKSKSARNFADIGSQRNAVAAGPFPPVVDRQGNF
jgi:hypothetical protein